MDIMVPCWQCSYSDSVTTVALKKFNNHNLEHHGDCTHKCEVCPNIFLTAEDLQHHLDVDHEKFVCTSCFDRNGDQTPLDLADFWSHYSDLHPLSKIRCDRCPNRFHHEKHYDEHKDAWHIHVPRTHLVKIKCENCKDGFSAERGALELHNAAIHNPKHFPYQCDSCGNVFDTSARCEYHSRDCPYKKD